MHERTIKQYKGKDCHGFSIVEILVAITVVFAFFFLMIGSFRGLSEQKVLETASEQVLSVFKDARSRTLASDGDSTYGVFVSITTAELVIFRGTAYLTSNPSNKTIELDDRIEISSSSIGGSDDTVIFSRLSGGAVEPGTTTIRLINDPAREMDIVLYTTGLAEIK